MFILVRNTGSAKRKRHPIYLKSINARIDNLTIFKADAVRFTTIKEADTYKKEIGLRGYMVVDTESELYSYL